MTYARVACLQFLTLQSFHFSNHVLGSRTFHHHSQLRFPWPSSTFPTSCSIAESSPAIFTFVSSSMAAGKLSMPKAAMTNIGAIMTIIPSAAAYSQSGTECSSAPPSVRSRKIACVMSTCITARAPGIGFSYSKIHRPRTNRRWTSGYIRRDNIGGMLHWCSRDRRMRIRTFRELSGNLPNVSQRQMGSWLGFLQQAG